MDVIPTRLGESLRNGHEPSTTDQADQDEIRTKAVKILSSTLDGMDGQQGWRWPPRWTVWEELTLPRSPAALAETPSPQAGNGPTPAASRN